MSTSVYQAQSLGDLADVAGSLAPSLCGKIVYLSGEVGAGKTTFVSALAPHLGYSGSVSSPTFTLINEYYPSASVPTLPMLPIYHGDFYRLHDAQQLDNIGFWDLVDNRATILVEWSESVSLSSLLPPDCTITFTRLAGSGDLGCYLEVVFHHESSV